MNICQVIFSSNRLEYLIPTLEAQSNLDFGDHIVHKIFFDDYPLGRNDDFIYKLAKSYGYNEIILHTENKGLSETWNEFFELIINREYDYIWQQEDDVKILQHVNINDLIECLENDTNATQVVLQRQPWYSYELDLNSNTTYISWKKYLLEKFLLVFSPMASLYSKEIANINFKKTYGYNPNEGLIMRHLQEVNPNAYSIKMRNLDGSPIIHHIGDYTQGKKISPGEPGWEHFNYDRFDPTKKYDSRTGIVI